jgi:Zn-dependent protease
MVGASILNVGARHRAPEHAGRERIAMRQSIKLGRVVGISIGAHWSVLVITALLTYGLYASVLPVAAPGAVPALYAVVALALAVTFLCCLLAHELAHALVARHFHVGVSRITLWLLGGVSELEREAPTPRAELCIAGAGPLTSLTIGGVAAMSFALLDAVSAPHMLLMALLWLAGSISSSVSSTSCPALRSTAGA